MVSNSSKTKLRRIHKKAKQGRDRKRKLERQGSTPKFPIHPEGGKASTAAKKPAAAKKPKPAAASKPAADKKADTAG